MSKFVLTSKNLRGGRRKETLNEIFERPDMKRSLNRPEEKKAFSGELSSKKNYTKNQLKKILVELAAGGKSINSHEARHAARALGIKNISNAEVRRELRRQQKESAVGDVETSAEKRNRERDENRTSRSKKRELAEEIKERRSRKRSDDIVDIRKSFGVRGEHLKGAPDIASSQDISQLRGGIANKSRL